MPRKLCQRCHQYQVHAGKDPYCKDCMLELLSIGQALKKDKSGSKDSKGRLPTEDNK